MSSTQTQPAATPLTELPAWKALEQHAAAMSKVHLRQLFADDPAARRPLFPRSAGLHLDFSKNRITDETLSL